MDLRDNVQFEQLLKPLEALLLNKIYAKVQNVEVAKELYHNTIVSGLSNFSQLREKQKFPAWMIRIAMNETKLYFRKEQARRNAELVMDMQDPLNTPLFERNDDDGDSVENAVLNFEEKRRLNQAIATLETNDRLILFMAYNQAMPLSEIANVLDTSLASVKMRKRRALDKLKNLLKE